MILNQRSLLAYLRSDVVRGSTEGLGGDAVQHIFFTHAEVRDLNVALAVQHHVIQLQVPAGGTKEQERSSNSSIHLKSLINKPIALGLNVCKCGFI